MLIEILPDPEQIKIFPGIELLVGKEHSKRIKGAAKGRIGDNKDSKAKDRKMEGREER